MTTQESITKDERTSLNVANCLCCTIAESMRDCRTCPFNVGLVFKSLQTIKQAETPVNVSALRTAFIQQIKDSNLVFMSA